MHILIAPNAFKNSLTAQQAAEAIEAGLGLSNLEFTCNRFPVADGGDGTGSLLIEKFGGTLVNTIVHDPLGRTISSSFGLIDNGKTAVIEMADASGIRLLEQQELNPMRTNTYGTGELIRYALDKGVDKILIAMGGSATVDGGSGLLQALGIKFLDVHNEILEARPEYLADLSAIDISELDPRIANCEIIVLCDVSNRLTGDEGAAKMFGPQKGAGSDDVKMLEGILSKIAELAVKLTGKDITNLKHGGTAGGAAAGVYAFLNAGLVEGATYFLELTGFKEALESADLVITGEGSIDEQTLSGKGPFAVASRSKHRNVPVIGIAGKVPSTLNAGFKEYFDVLLPIGNGPADMETAIRLTDTNLRRTAAEIGNLLAIKQKEK